MKRVKPLTKAEEPEVVRRAQAGDKAARDTLVLANMGLAYRIAHTYAGACSIPVEDVVQYAVEGLIRAIDKFSLEKKVRFPTYAVPWMWAYVSRGIVGGEILMHSGPRIHRRVRLAEMSKDTRRANFRSLDAPVGRESDMPLSETIGDGSEDVDDALSRGRIASEVRARIAEVKLRCTPLERDILENRIVEQNATGTEIASRHLSAYRGKPISREWVRQTEVKLRARLKMELAQIHRKAA